MALDALDLPTLQRMRASLEVQSKAEAAARAKEREERLKREGVARAATAAANAAVRTAAEERKAAGVTATKKDAGPLGGAAASPSENKDAGRFLTGLGTYGDLPKAEMSSLASAIANEAKAIMRTNKGVQAPQAYAMAHEKLKKSGAITEITTFGGLGKRQAFRPLGANVTPPVTARAISSQAEYDKLAPGTTYTWNGKTYTKGQR